MSYIDIGSLALAEIVGDFGFKEFANKGGMPSFAVGSIGYVGVIYFLIRSLQGSQVILVNAAWDGISAVIETIAAMVILGEGFSDFKQYLGIVFIVIGLLFLKIPWKRQNEFKFSSLFGTPK